MGDKDKISYVDCILVHATKKYPIKPKIKKKFFSNFITLIIALMLVFSGMAGAVTEKIQADEPILGEEDNGEWNVNSSSNRTL